MLQPQHQLDQLFLRQALQISAIHLPMDSGIVPADKGVGNYPNIIEHAMNNWSELHYKKRQDGISGPFFYGDHVYKGLGF